MLQVSAIISLICYTITVPHSEICHLSAMIHANSHKQRKQWISKCLCHSMYNLLSILFINGCKRFFILF